MTLWLEESRRPLAGDWAARPTSRVQLADGRSAILIETVPDDDPKSIQGHRIADFVRIADLLRTHDIRAPEIYAAQPERGFLLVEDFGDACWARLLPGDEEYFYTAALETLQKFRSLQIRGAGLPAFINSYIFGRTVWYLDEYKQDKDPHKRQAFIQIWDTLMATMPHGEPCFVHGDFHPGNLMRLADGGMGILDFAAAMQGNGHYDLVNLLEDIRRDVPEPVKAMAKTRYDIDDDVYAIFHAQFYMRLLGQMTKRGMNVPKRIPLTLDALMHRHAVLAPLKSLVFGG